MTIGAETTEDLHQCQAEVKEYNRTERLASRTDKIPGNLFVAVCRHITKLPCFLKILMLFVLIFCIVYVLNCHTIDLIEDAKAQ